MLELKTDKNIFWLPQDGEAMCITTNGIVKSNGHAVMGAGIAKETNDIFHISKKLGSYLNQYGNRAFNMGKFSNGFRYFTVFTLPTKYHYKDKSDIELIRKSCKELKEMCEKFNISRCFLVPPGCGLGGLNYEVEVRPVISQILDDDRFVVVLKP